MIAQATHLSNCPFAQDSDRTQGPAGDENAALVSALGTRPI